MRGHSRSEEILALNCLFLFTFNGLLLFSAFPFWSTHVGGGFAQAVVQ